MFLSLSSLRQFSKVIPKRVPSALSMLSTFSTSAATIPLPKTEASSNPNLKSITKIMAESGVCSRQEAEKFVREGRVTINGDKCISPLYRMELNATDNISIDGVKIKKHYTIDRRARLWAIRKREGEIVADSDNKNRPLLINRFMSTIDQTEVRENPNGFKPVYRLEYLTEGLCLFSNSGDLARLLNTDASQGRQFRVRVHGLITDSKLEGLRTGLFIDGIKYKPMDVTFVTKAGTITWLNVTVYENKNQALKKCFEKLFLKITRAICTGFGPYKVDDCFPAGSNATCVELKMTPELNSLYLKMMNNKVISTKTQVRKDLSPGPKVTKMKPKTVEYRTTF